MFKSLNDIVGKKTLKHPNFKIFNIQKKCEECEDVILKNLNTKSIKVLNIKNNIINISCENKIILNELQLRKNDILKEIRNNIKEDIKDIKRL